MNEETPKVVTKRAHEIAADLVNGAIEASGSTILEAVKQIDVAKAVKLKEALLHESLQVLAEKDKALKAFRNSQIFRPDSLDESEMKPYYLPGAKKKIAAMERPINELDTYLKEIFTLCNETKPVTLDMWKNLEQSMTTVKKLTIAPSPKAETSSEES